MTYKLFQFIPLNSQSRVARITVDVIELAASFGEDRWGMSAYSDGIRVNVGWTEILTAHPHHLRLIVDGELARALALPNLSQVNFDTGKDPRGFYPSIPGSVCLEILYEPAQLLEDSINLLAPALTKAVQLAARRRASSGVKAGHNQKAVEILATMVGRSLPAPTYAISVDAKARENTELVEGALRLHVSSQYERNPAARSACIQHYGTICFICKFSFESVYGELGRGFIHVHHLVPLSSIGETYRIDPIKDLRPVCPNCHAMLHRRDPPISIDELRDLLHL